MHRNNVRRTVQCLQMHMKSGVLMTGGKDKAIKIWDIRTGTCDVFPPPTSFSR